MPSDTSPEGQPRMRSKRIRPYTLTGGRTRARHELLVEALVSVPDYDPSLPETLMPESRMLYEHARSRASIAELSVAVGAPLGVVRVLISDLAAQGAVYVHPTAHTYHHDREMLGRILDGLQRLPV
ncbi:DUF742 domain-containing protein [Pseudonocardia sp. C8]|uniref:DUF742 domain-containing protein n=1 Tax=Pseudonocardia sp. C8 TaxID=2762759 RepID=UPI001642F5FF|nr:DUF742 domain-containing protein [Pseudonocardia sp. C8]MBC3193458.1 DUF742 domain-containing protein [Pseudonocardia sp. C8]